MFDKHRSVTNIGFPLKSTLKRDIIVDTKYFFTDTFI